MQKHHYYIITGASKGIGFSLVKHALLNKQHVIAISRNTKSLEDLQKENPNLKVLSIDLTSHKSILPLIDYIKQDGGKIDTLINNAGLLINKPFTEITQEDFQNMYDVNVKAPFFLTQSILPYFNEKSHVVNIGSMGGIQGASKFPGLSGYSSSKGALATLTECMAEELKKEGVIVNCLCLGAVQTEMLSQAFPGFKAPTTPEQMAEYIFYFSRNTRNYYNGKVLPVSNSTP